MDKGEEKNLLLPVGELGKDAIGGLVGDEFALDFDGMGAMKDDDDDDEAGSKASVESGQVADLDFNLLSRVLDGFRPAYALGNIDHFDAIFKNCIGGLFALLGRRHRMRE